VFVRNWRKTLREGLCFVELGMVALQRAQEPTGICPPQMNVDAWLMFLSRTCKSERRGSRAKTAQIRTSTGS
jgi:hypothetical protein